mmetsp:Transcript_13761/g.37176  ORF Transcript_13761/g.37176 Transcript_13761/m.37176 type:complete len:209 (-) Transcript_13761:304-930(-)
MRFSRVRELPIVPRVRYTTKPMSAGRAALRDALRANLAAAFAKSSARQITPCTPPSAPRTDCIARLSGPALTPAASATNSGSTMRRSSGCTGCVLAAGGTMLDRASANVMSSSSGSTLSSSLPSFRRLVNLSTMACAPSSVRRRLGSPLAHPILPANTPGRGPRAVKAPIMSYTILASFTPSSSPLSGLVRGGPTTMQKGRESASPCW